jgi:putative ABC transport system permease protein
MIQDLRYSFRLLLKSPGFTSVAVMTLALGIGANTAIFSVINAALLRSLPYRNADELVLIYYNDSRGDGQMFVPALYSPIKQQNRVFTDCATWDNSTWPVNLTGDGEPERLQGFKVSANLFDLLGVSAKLGRTFAVEEDYPGNNHVVVISYDLWQRRFAGEPRILGRRLSLNGTPYQVIGVMPADFRFILKTDVWTPLAFTPAEEADRGGIYLHLIARLKKGVLPDQARADVERLLRLNLEDQNSAVHAIIAPLQTVLMGDARESLFALFAEVGFVLLIACSNLANLQLARAAVRRRELTIRAALGATRARLVRQLLIESAVISLVGAAGGSFLAKWAIQFLVGGLPAWIAAKNSHVAALTLDGWALSYTAGLSILATIIFGLIPAMRASKLSLGEALRESGRSHTGGRGHSRFRSILVVAEVALAVILLVGAGLMIKSFWRLATADLGYDPEGVLTAKIDLAGDRYREPVDIFLFYNRLLERLSSIPGVEQAGLTNGFLDRGVSVVVAEHSAAAQEEKRFATRNPVSTDFFRSMRIPLIRGRLFTDQDSAGALPVAIIDETVQKRYFPDEDPIGKHLVFTDALREIVGVVGATRAWKAYTISLDQEVPRVYLPYKQEQPWSSTTELIVRAKSGNPASLIPAMRTELAGIDKDQPIHSFELLSRTVSELRADRRFATLLLTLLACIAVLLSVIGIYGVLAYSVSQRTPEMGIRLALGAQTSDVLRLVVGDGMRAVSIGLVIGLLGSFALTKGIESMLFEVRATDPLTYLVIIVFFGLAAVLACLGPAKRATRVDPIIALRFE